MRMAFLIERLDPGRGGAETYVHDFTRMLAADGHDVHVFSRAQSVVPEGVTLRSVNVHGVGRAWRTLSFARGVERMLDAEQFDVVQGVGRTWTQDVYQPHGGVHCATALANAQTCGGMRMLAKGLGETFGPKQAVFRWIERRQYLRRPPRVFVALSEMVKTDMQTFYHLPAAKIEVVYNGVDTARFHPGNREGHRAALKEKHDIADEEVVFLIVAHNFRLKGVPELVECVTGDFPSCRLMVVGRNGMTDKLKAYAERRAPGRVIFTGAVRDTAPCYAAADVYVHPTNYDPCSLVVLEALASGLPVVTSVMNGAAELLTDTSAGYIVPPAWTRRTRGADYLTELAGVMRKLFDTALRKRMGAAARALAEQHTTRHNYRHMMGIYQKVVSGKEGK